MSSEYLRTKPQAPLLDTQSPLSRLGTEGRALVSAVMGRECDSACLNEFIALPAGVRDLRIQNHAASIWTSCNGNWRGKPEENVPDGFSRCEATRKEVYSACGLADAAAEEKRQAALNPANLTPKQLSIIASVFNIKPEAVASETIADFGTWVNGDTIAIKEFMNKRYPDREKVKGLARRLDPEYSRFAEFNADDTKILDRVLADTGEQPSIALLRTTRSRRLAKVIALLEKNVAGFHVVLNSTEEKTDLKRRIASRVYEFAEKLDAVHELWLRPGREERMTCWQFGTTNLLTLTDLLHKTRFRHDVKHTAEELGIVRQIFYGTTDQNVKVGDTHVFQLERLLTTKTTSFPSMEPEASATLAGKLSSPSSEYDESERLLLERFFARRLQDIPPDYLASLGAAMQKRILSKVPAPVNFYHPPLLSLCSLSADFSVASLLEAARAQAEFNTLISFLGVPARHASATLDYSGGVSRPRLRKEPDAPSGDAFSSAVVRFGDGSDMHVDAVFDGLSGHDNGHVASGIAREVFEISLLAGWIRNPESARRALVMADLAITVQQIRNKTDNTPIQEDNMAASAVVGLQRGMDFHGLHCGNGIYRVIRNGEAVFTSVGHTSINDRLGVGVPVNDPEGVISVLSAMPEVTLDASGELTLEPTDILQAVSDGARTSFSFIRGDAVLCSGYGPPALEPMLGQAVGLGAFRNRIRHALGASTDIAINNLPLANGAFPLAPGDLVVTASDGFGNAVCDHAVHGVVKNSSGDIQAARRQVLELAVNKITLSQSGDSGACSCGGLCALSHTDDDLTLILRQAAVPARLRAAAYPERRGVGIN